MLYSLKDLSAIFNSRHTLTRDRFIHYFTLRYNYSEKQASEAHRLYSQFPKGIYNQKESEILDKVIPKALELYNELQEGWAKRNLLKISYEKLIKKLVFKKDGEVKEVVLDFYEANDIITYAELLKNKEVEMVALLSLSCELYGERTPLVFVGDIFDTNDKFWGDKSDVYVAQEKGSFKRLLYIKGKGYTTGRDELNYELDKTYSSYVLKLEEYEKIGNVLIGYSVLID